MCENLMCINCIEIEKYEGQIRRVKKSDLYLDSLFLQVNINNITWLQVQLSGASDLTVWVSDAVEPIFRV